MIVLMGELVLRGVRGLTDGDSLSFPSSLCSVDLGDGVTMAIGSTQAEEV